MVYLIHFQTRLHHAGHYIGFTDNLQARIQQHSSGQGARLLQVLNEKEIPWNVVRIWPEGTKGLESELKHQKHGPRLCPICNPASESKFLKGSDVL